MCSAVCKAYHSYICWVFILVLVLVSMSAIVSGRGLFFVSGSQRLSTPPLIPRIPKITNCTPGIVSPAITIKGDSIAPARARPETRPMAELRILVANTSPERIYATLNEAAIHILPNNARLVARELRKLPLKT